MKRPEYDRALEGVLASPRILLPANRLVEVDRMLRFAAELKQPTIIYGGREAYRDGAADLFKKYNTPVLISLKWPTFAPMPIRKLRQHANVWKTSTRRHRRRPHSRRPA